MEKRGVIIGIQSAGDIYFSAAAEYRPIEFG